MVLFFSIWTDYTSSQYLQKREEFSCCFFYIKKIYSGHIDIKAENEWLEILISFVLFKFSCSVVSYTKSSTLTVYILIRKSV